MVMPLFLHLAVPAKKRRDYVAELSAATHHLGIGIEPDSSWPFAMSRVRAIGAVSYGINQTIKGVISLDVASSGFSLSGGASGSMSTKGKAMLVSGGGVVVLPESSNSFSITMG